MPKGPPIKLPKLKFPKLRFKRRTRSRSSSRSASPQSTSLARTNPQEYSVTPVNSTTQANSPQHLQIMLLEFKLYRGILRNSLRGLTEVITRREYPQRQAIEVQNQTIQEADYQQFDKERNQGDNCEWEDSQYQECLRKNSENCKLMFEILKNCQNRFSSTSSNY